MIGQSLQLEMALAFIAAVTGAPDALDRGDAAAKRLVQDDVWSVADHTIYLAKTPQERINFWASGDPLKKGGYTQQSLALIQQAYEDFNGKIGLLTGETQAKAIWGAFKKLAELTGLKAVVDEVGGGVIIPESAPTAPPLEQPGTSWWPVVVIGGLGLAIAGVAVAAHVVASREPRWTVEVTDSAGTRRVTSKTVQRQRRSL